MDPCRILCVVRTLAVTTAYRVVQKTDTNPLVNFDDNFGKHGPILTIYIRQVNGVNGEIYCDAFFPSVRLSVRLCTLSI